MQVRFFEMSHHGKYWKYFWCFMKTNFKISKLFTSHQFRVMTISSSRKIDPEWRKRTEYYLIFLSVSQRRLGNKAWSNLCFCFSIGKAARRNEIVCWASCDLLSFCQDSNWKILDISSWFLVHTFCWGIWGFLCN